MVRYNKPPTTVVQQAKILMDRGLLIEDLEQAKKQLQVIGYYRLSGYFKAFQVNECFNTGVTFQHIIQLYDNDRRLRCCMLGAIERIEIAVKALLHNHLALQFGTHWYKLPQFAKLAPIIEGHKGLNDSKTHKFIHHYKTTYQEPDSLPSWMVFEVLGFADISKICSQLPYQHLKALTQLFDHAPEVLVSWLRALTVTRNVCAHHARLWDRTYNILPKRSKEVSSQISHKSTAEQLAIIHYLLDKIDCAPLWLAEIAIILQAIEGLVGLEHMGFRNSNVSTKVALKLIAHQGHDDAGEVP